MRFLNKLLEFIAENHLFKAEESILLAVSGGKDSVFLSHLFAQAGFNFGIAHCNFKLRGRASDEDELFVKRLADRYGVQFHSTSFETENYAKKQGLSIQMAARELRYQWLENIREANGCSYIAIAHHQTDSVETVLLNLLRGTGIGGLSGILPKRNRIIRPLLAFSAKEVEEGVRELSLEFREDESNRSVKYKRNSLRIEVLPVLRKINPSLEQTFVANSRRFQMADAFIKKHAEGIRNRLFSKKSSDEVIISVALLQEHEPLELWLYELFSPYGFTEPVLSDLKREMNNGSGKSFFSGSHQLVIDRGNLILKEIGIGEVEDLTVESFPSQIDWFGSFFKISIAQDSKISWGANIQLVDYDKIQLPLIFRTWQKGDRFQPLGMHGRKKISDFLISLKIPITRKKSIPIVVDSKGLIIAVLPWRINEQVKITSKTKKVLIFEKIENEKGSLY